MRTAFLGLAALLLLAGAASAATSVTTVDAAGTSVCVDHTTLIGRVLAPQCQTAPQDLGTSSVHVLVIASINPVHVETHNQVHPI